MIAIRAPVRTCAKHNAVLIGAAICPACTSTKGMTMTDTKTVLSTGDERTINNTVRHQYRQLTDAEKAAVGWIKDSGAAFIAYCADVRANGISPREMSLAITKMEEAVFWAVKGFTA